MPLQRVVREPSAFLIPNKEIYKRLHFHQVSTPKGIFSGRGLCCRLFIDFFEHLHTHAVATRSQGAKCISTTQQGNIVDCLSTRFPLPRVSFLAIDCVADYLLVFDFF